MSSRRYCGLENWRSLSNGNDFIFDTFPNFEPVKRFENMVSSGGPGSCNNGMGEIILDMLESIQLRFRKIKVQ